jgi:REP element-mobilizing transposase RayT
VGYSSQTKYKAAEAAIENMTHSYKIHFFHLIWSTKQRYLFITPDIQSRLYLYMGAIIRNHSGKLLEIGGMPDHVHLLVEIANLDKFSSFIRDIKASSSLWIHKNFPEFQNFAWQEGYGSFSVSYSSIKSVQEYIQNQEFHHKNLSFEEEYLKFLNLHQVKFDERFVLG